MAYKRMFVGNCTEQGAEADYESKLVFLPWSRFSRFVPLVDVSIDREETDVQMKPDVTLRRHYTDRPCCGEEIVVPDDLLVETKQGLRAKGWARWGQMRDVLQLNPYFIRPPKKFWVPPVFYAISRRPLDQWTADEVKDLDSTVLLGWREGAKPIDGVPTLKFDRIVLHHFHCGLPYRLTNFFCEDCRMIEVAETSIVEGIIPPDAPLGYYAFHDGLWERCTEVPIWPRYGRAFRALSGCRTGELIPTETGDLQRPYFETDGPLLTRIGKYIRRVNVCRQRTPVLYRS